MYSKTRRARFAKRNPNRARHSAPERSGDIALLVPLPFVSPTHPLARAVDDRDVDFVTAREKYSHSRRANRSERPMSSSRSFTPRDCSKTFPSHQYFCAGLDLAYDEGSMANFSHLGTYARLEKLS